MSSDSHRTRCNAYNLWKATVIKHLSIVLCPRSSQPKSKFCFGYIVNDPALVIIEIKALCCENTKLRKANARKVFVRNLKVNGKGWTPRSSRKRGQQFTSWTVRSKTPSAEEVPSPRRSWNCDKTAKITWMQYSKMAAQVEAR